MPLPMRVRPLLSLSRKLGLFGSTMTDDRPLPKEAPLNPFFHHLSAMPSALKALQLTMQSPEPPRDVDMHDGEDQGALPCHGRPGVDQSKELPSNEKEVDETLEEQAAELGATPGRGKGSPDTASTALQLALSQSPADHDTSPPEESETPRVDIQAGEDQAPLSSQELLPFREEIEQLKDQLPPV
jgi:hypothetical protein